MKQMLHRLVDIEGGHESLAVEAEVGHQLRKLLLKPRRHDEKHEGQFIFHPTPITVLEYDYMNESLLSESLIFCLYFL